MKLHGIERFRDCLVCLEIVGWDVLFVIGRWMLTLGEMLQLVLDFYMSFILGLDFSRHQKRV